MSTPTKAKGQGKKSKGQDRPAKSDPTPTSSATKTDDTIPTRPRGGFKRVDIRTKPENVLKKADSKGCTSVEVLANYVPIASMKSRVVCMYRVDFEPAVEVEDLRKFLFASAARELFERKPIYDNVHECRSGQKLPAKVTPIEIADVKGDQKYIVTFTNTGSCSHGAEMTRLYNMHMSEFLGKDLGFYSPERGLFVHPSHSQAIGQEIMMLRGFRTSANTHEDNKILMNLEASHKLVQKFSVLEMMERKKRQSPGRDIRAMLEEALVGKAVVTSYNKICYRIEEIDYQTKLTDTFVKDGKTTTFLDYYRAKYNLNIKNPSQPLLRVVVNNRRRRDEESKVILLLPEFCNIAGLTNEQKNDGRLKFQLIKDTQVDPTNRVKHLREFLKTFHENQKIKEKLTSWGYSYETEPCSLQANVLPMTNFTYNPRGSQMNFQVPKTESADINVNGLAVVPKIPKLYLITPRALVNSKASIRQVLLGGFNRVRLVAQQIEEMDLPNDNAHAYTNAIRQLPADTTIAIVIMDRQNKEKYDAIKKAASCQRGLITQVITSSLILDTRKGQSASVKIAIQVAAKLGGEPWLVDIPVNLDAMICGYDTYHDTTKRGRSFGAFVASLNPTYSRWWSKADAHERFEEISSQMSTNLGEALKVYKKFNKKLPSRVIIYRDGVGDGQLEHVFKVEVDKIREELAKLPSKVFLTFVIVNKRIGARFYMKNRQEFRNPPPGTVIDHTVTRQERFDFYLISQFTRQGTVTPTYYNIIHDENKYPAAVHQRMAFKLCLLYYNWSGTVRVPAPCQYAHKLALLCGEHLHAQPNAQMDDKLHFL